LDDLGVPRGLEAVGYSKEDIPMLVEGTLPQRRVLDLAPGVGDVADEEGREHLTRILEASLKYWKCFQHFDIAKKVGHYLIHGSCESSNSLRISKYNYPSFCEKHMPLQFWGNRLVPFDQILKSDQITSEYIQGTYYDIEDQNRYQAAMSSG
jgi:hypothetical protein